MNQTNANLFINGAHIVCNPLAGVVWNGMECQTKAHSQVLGQVGNTIVTKVLIFPYLQIGFHLKTLFWKETTACMGFEQLMRPALGESHERIPEPLNMLLRLILYSKH